MIIKLMKDSFYNEFETKKKLCKFIMSAEKLSMGDKCSEFESKFSNYQGRKYAVMFNSGSSANLAILQAALNSGLLKLGNEVAFSSLTWATNVMPIIQLGFKPVPVDVSLKTINVSPGEFEKIIKETKIKAFFITNLLGFCDDIKKIKDICEKNKILLFEDNCESLGSEVDGKKLGNFGFASSFSFFVGHHLSTIEGGMVCTDDLDFYNMLKMVRAHGWIRDVDQTLAKKFLENEKVDDFYARYAFFVPGYNLRPTEISGFLGLEQLKFVEQIVSKREENYLKFMDAALSNKDVLHNEYNFQSRISNFAFPLILKDEKTFEKYKKSFIDNGVEIRPIVAGSIVKQPFFKQHVSENKSKCQNAEKIHAQGFYLPNRPDLTDDEINLICDLIKGKK